MLDFMDAIRAAARAAAEAAARAAAEAAREAAERAAREAAERAQRAAEARETQRQQDTQNTQQAQQSQQTQQTQQDPQAKPADQPDKPQALAVTPALYTPSTTGVQAPRAMQVDAPAPEKPRADPAEEARKKKESDARALTDGWQQEAQDAYDKVVADLDGRAMTDKQWQPLGLKYGNVMGGAQNELRVAANNAAATGGDVKAAVEAKAEEIRKRYDDPNVALNIDETKTQFLKNESTQEARNTQGARFNVVLAQEKEQQAAARVDEEQAAYLKIPGGIRRFELEADDELVAARDAHQQAQQERVKAEETFLAAMQKEIDTVAANAYQQDANQALKDLRNDPHDRTISMADRSYDLTLANGKVSDADAQLQALASGKGVKVPDSYRQQAVQDLKARYGTEGGMGQLIDRVDLRGRIAGEMEHLTPSTDFERKLAQNDPTTLAMAQAQGLTLDPEAKTDPNSTTPRDLPQAERALMEHNPAGYVMYKALGADSLVPAPDLPATDPARIAYDKGVAEKGLLGYTVAQLKARSEDPKLSQAERDQAASGLNRMLGFMEGSVPLRVDAMTRGIDQKLDSGDVTGALQIRKAGADAAQTPEERQLYVDVHNDRFSGDLFKAQIEASMDKDLKNKTHDDEGRPIIGQEKMYADKVGVYLQEVAPHLIEEDAGTLLDTVKAKYSNDWTGRNNSQSPGYNDWDDFYHGLSAVVDAADAGYYARNPQAKPGTAPAATGTASWLTDRDNEVSMLMMMNQGGSSRQGRIYGGAQDAAAKGHIGLSAAFEQSLKSSKDAPVMSDVYLRNAVQRGSEDYAGTDEAKEANQRFELDKDEILRQTFDSLAMRKEELSAKASDEKGLSEAIALGAPQGDANAIREQIAADAKAGTTVKAIPMYVAGPGGVPYQTAVFEFEGKDGKTLWVDDQGAVYGKEELDAKRDFQENNLLSDKGTVYFAENLDLGRDGHVDYAAMDAHIVTTSEKVWGWVNLGVAAVGAVAGGVLAVASGGTLTPLVAAAWVGMVGSMGYGVGTSWAALDNISDHGRSVNPFASQEAMAQWLNVAGSLAGMGGMGLAKTGALAMNAGTRLAGSTNPLRQMAGGMLSHSAGHYGTASRVLNGVGFGIGGVQTLQQAAMFAEHGSEMSVSEKLQNGAMLLMGATQMLPMALQKRIGESVRDGYQAMRGRTGAGDLPGSNGPGRGLGPEALGAFRDGDGTPVPAATRPTTRRGVPGRDADAQPPARTDADGQSGRSGKQADGEPAPGAARPATPERASGNRPAPDGGATPARDLRTPQRLTPWQSARLSTAAAFDMAVTRGAILQERVIHGMMDRAMSRAMARYMTESAARNPSGERSGSGRADAPVPASRRRTATGTPALARAPRHPSGDGEGGVQRRTVSHGPAVVAHADGPEAPARMSLRQNAISPLDNVLWIDGSMENIGVPYGAEMAARALADLDSVMIVTGPLTAHGRAETNGPVGAASLGAYLASLGKDVVYVTDRAHARTLRQMLRQDLNQPNARVETFSARDFASAGRQSRALLAMHKPQAVVAVEVAGRNTNNEYRLQNGERVRGNAMLDQLLIDANDMADMVTIAVGDHGNEAGMRAARDRLLRDMAVTEQLADSWSDVGADHLVTGMNSNLAAQAIGFGLQRALGRDSGMPSVETVGALLDTMARHKARDGVTLEVGATSVRGYDKTVQKGVYELLQKAAERLPAGLDMAQLFEGIQRRFLPEGIDPADFGIRVQDDAIVITAFDSSNGGLLAAQNIARHTYAMTGKAVQVVAFTDHAAGTYGGRERGDLVNLVHAGVVAAQKAKGAVDLFACNTACTAFPEALAGTHQAKVVNLIMQTAPKIVTEGGARPVVVATPGTVKLHAYLTAVAEASGGSVTVKEIGATEWADAVNNLMHLADGPQLEQLKGLVAKYINAEQIPADATSLWFCCTHYPALETLVRQQLDAIGRSDVRLIDPMQYQARKGVEMLVDQGLIDRGALLEQPLDPSAVPDDKTLPTIVFTTGQPSRVSGLAHAMGRRPDIRVFKTAFGEAADVSPALALVDGGRHLSPVDRISFNYIGRGLREFYMPGGAERAAASLEDASNVMLVTGFSVAKDMPETDGPPGTAELGRALRLRGKQVTYVVDSANRPILEGILREMGEPLDNIRVFDEPIDSAAEPARALLREVGPDRVMAIELPSRSARGTKHNMRGIGIDDFNPALDQIVLEANAIDGIETLGVGDGGNEAGMGGVGGLIPRALDGSDIAAVVPVDHVVTASVSNWGAYAVSALLLRRGNMPERFQSPEELGRVLQAAADAGAVDGVSRERVATVDGFSTEVHQAVITLYGRAAAGGEPRGPGAARAPLPGGPAPARTPLADAAEAVVAHGGQLPRKATSTSRADDAGSERAAMPAGRPAIRDGSWSVRDGAPSRAAIEATVDGIHGSGGRLAGVHYVVAHGDGLSVPLRAGLPEASFLSLQQAMRDLGPALQAGGNFRIAMVSQREAARHGAVDARSVIGTVPLSLRGHKPHAEGFALNPDYHGEIRAALPDDFRAGLPLVRQQDGRRIDVLAQLEQFPRGRADLDLAQQAGQKTFGDEAVAVSVPQIPGHFTVRAEGLFGGIAMRAGGRDDGPRPLLDAPAVIDRIRAHPDYQEGMPVVLYGCYGQDGAVSLVQQLATGLNARVYGADGRLEVDAFRASGSDLAYGARLRVAADPVTMAASGAPVHVQDGGRFHGAMPALPVVAVTSGGKPVRPHGARAAGDPVPASWRQTPDRWAELALGEPAVRVNAPRDHLVVVGAVRPEGGLRGEGGEGIGAHELAFQLAHDWEPGQPIVLALDGAHAPQGRMLAQQVADVMRTDVLVPEFALRRGAYAQDPAKSQIDLAQPGRWRRLSPQPDPYAGHSFKIDHHGNVFLRRPDGTRERVRLETYLGPRLGSGGAKTVFALGKDLAVGIANEAWLGDMVHGERAAMAEAAGTHGLNTVRSFGPESFEAFGRPAIGYERYAASTKDLFDGAGQLRPQHAALLNDRSARDIAALADTMKTRGLHLGDVEFALFPDGAVKVADLTHVETGSEAPQGSAVYGMLDRMQQAGRARRDDVTRGGEGGEGGEGGVVRATISHGPAGNAPPPGSNGPRPWKVRTALAVSAAGTFAAASGAAAISAQTGANLVLTSAGCFIYRGSVAMGRTVHAGKVIRRAGTHTPADIAWLRRTLTEKPGTAVWGINDSNQQKFAKALDQLDAYAHHADKKDLPEAADKIREAQAVIGTIGASLLTPDTRAGQVNDALQLTTLAINNGNTMLWFGEHGVTQIGEPLTYSSAVFLAANSVLSTVNFAARAGYHTGLAQPALLGARLRKFVMNAYSVGAVPLAAADMMHTGGVVGAIEAGSLAVFGIGAHLQSRNEQKLINAEKNRLAKAADPDAVDKPVTPWLAQKWEFFGRAMPKGLVLLGGGVIVNFGAKILVELLKDEDKGAPRPTPTPGGGPSTPPTADPGVPTPPQQPPKEPPSQTPRERPASGPVRVQPYSPDNVASSTLWGIAGAHLDTLLSDGQKAEAQARAMTPDQQVANFALRELINLNPRYRLADNPDHLEPGWELDVTR